MGVTFPDGVIWPEEKTSWTAAAVLLAHDALHDITPGEPAFQSRLLESETGLSREEREISSRRRPDSRKKSHFSDILRLIALRRDHRPYILKRLDLKFQKWYANHFLRPQFEHLGRGMYIHEALACGDLRGAGCPLGIMPQ